MHIGVADGSRSQFLRGGDGKIIDGVVGAVGRFINIMNGDEHIVRVGIGKLCQTVVGAFSLCAKTEAGIHLGIGNQLFNGAFLLLDGLLQGNGLAVNGNADIADTVINDFAAVLIVYLGGTNHLVIVFNAEL